MEGGTDQTVFYRTLPAKTSGTTTSLQQLTAGNTPNLVLKTILTYFVKVPPLKKILQKENWQKVLNFVLTLEAGGRKIPQNFLQST